MSHLIDKPVCLVATNGIDIIHGPTENVVSTETGQPFVMYKDTKEDLIAFAFSEYIEPTEEDQDIEEVKTLIPIDWLTGYTMEEAYYVEAVYNSASTNSVIRPIKHPVRDEYAIPMNDDILGTYPEGEIKDSFTGVIAYKIANNQKLNKEQIIADGWFNKEIK